MSEDNSKSNNFHSTQKDKKNQYHEPNHSFSVRLAQKYGVHESILINHFAYWIGVNQRLNRNFHEGKTWTYQTLDEIAAHFPYFTKNQVFNLIEKLCLGKDRKSKKETLDFEPVLVKGNFNKVAYDRTIWYAFALEPDKIFGLDSLNEEQQEKSILQNDKIDFVGRQNGDSRTTTPIPNTIPYTKTPPPLSPPQKQSPKNATSQKRMEEEVSDCLREEERLSQAEKVRLTKSYSQEQIKSALEIARTHEIKKTMMHLMIDILKHPERWESSCEGQSTIEQLANRYNSMLESFDKAMFKENKRNIKNGLLWLKSEIGDQQISLNSAYAEQEIKQAIKLIKEGKHE